MFIFAFSSNCLLPFGELNTYIKCPNWTKRTKKVLNGPNMTKVDQKDLNGPEWSQHD